MKLREEVISRLRKPNQLCEDLSEGKMAYIAIGLTYEEMTLFYHKALELFRKQSYEEAVDAFLFLASLDQNNHHYWLGLGMSKQMCHEYEAAIDAYELAAVYDINSPVPYFYLAKCLFAIHDRESALEALDLAIDAADEKEEFQELKQEALKAKNVLSHAI